MPARLKTFDLNGYKTFASRTEFEFADGITAIVGPNGSGKSNIADALRWVLGEQSYGLLRGKKTEDMIFAGSEQRSRAGMAQATVVFNNGDGWLPIDFSEVAITRRAYRDGENEYLLNGQRVRLKDVSELLAKSGLAERTYTIIGQGLVDAALALKAEERRRLFEEAAGIGLYRARREESLRRLDTTRRNLERVQDILTELQPRLRSLERQAKRAQDYEQIRADLYVELKEYYGFHWHHAQNEFSKAHIAARKHEGNLLEAQQEQVRIDEEIARLRQILQVKHSEVAKYRKELAELELRRETIIRNRVVGQERLRLLHQQKEESEAELHRRQEILALLDEQKQLSLIETEQLSSELAEHTVRLTDAEQQYEKYQLEQAKIESKIQDARSNLAEILDRQAYLQARLDETRAFRKRQQSAIEAATNSIDRLRHDLELVQKDAEKTKRELMEAEQKLIICEQQHREEEVRYEDVVSNIDQANAEKDKLEGLLNRLKAEFNILEQAEKNLNGYADGSKMLLNLFGNIEHSGLYGAIGSFLLVPAEYEQAISAALGEYVDGFVFKDSGMVNESLDLLSREAINGAIFPVDKLKPPKGLKIDAEKIPGGENDVLGIASNLIGFPSELNKVIELLLGQVIVVKDRDTARKLIDGSNLQVLRDLRVVTLAGELFSVNGVIEVASSRGVLSRPRQMLELKDDLQEYENRLVVIRSQIHKFESSRSSIDKMVQSRLAELENAQSTAKSLYAKLQEIEISVGNINRNMDWYQGQKQKLDDEKNLDKQNEQILGEELEQLTTLADSVRNNLNSYSEASKEISEGDNKEKLSYWKTRVAVSLQASNDAVRRFQERIAEIERAQQENNAIVERMENITSDISNVDAEQDQIVNREQKINDDIDNIRSMIEPLEAEVHQIEIDQTNILAKDNDARQHFRTVEHYHTQAKINLVRQQEVLDSLRRRIEDDFGLVSFDYADPVTGPTPLPINGMVEELPLVKELSPEVEEIIQRQRAQLKRIGPVNLEAQSEYNEESDRYKFMTDQVTDLDKAERDIQEVISELDVLMKREFRRTFDAVAQEFRSIFNRLFNGGEARLVLTDPENIAETGIDIEARLPGRREQGLSLLSGGERSLTAVALVFALLRISPTPFCILDEVDAMLDEANVGRFRDVLKELSEKTQFIVITHNRNTVQAAGVIYGVTMGRDSASQVISLKLSEVSDEYGV
jgi:chromosome segregation protein